MTTQTRTKELHDLMQQHQLTTEQVASMLERRPTTVRIWRCKDDRRQIPKMALELLKLKAANK